MKRLVFTCSILLEALLILGCAKKETKITYNLPYPSQELVPYYQGRVDSLEYEWLTDSKGIASGFMNEYFIAGKDIFLDDVIIKSEGIFRAEVEIPLDTVSLTLSLERPFKERGTKSIWQVIKMEARPWPNPRSK